MNIKQEYNALLVRWKKAEIYMENEEIKYENRIKYADELYDLLQKMNYLLDQLQEQNIKTTEHEILNGFTLEVK